MRAAFGFVNQKVRLTRCGKAWIGHQSDSTARSDPASTLLKPIRPCAMSCGPCGRQRSWAPRPRGKAIPAALSSPTGILPTCPELSPNQARTDPTSCPPIIMPCCPPSYLPTYLVLATRPQLPKSPEATQSQAHAVGSRMVADTRTRPARAHVAHTRGSKAYM